MEAGKGEKERGPGRPAGKSSFVPDRSAERRYVKEGLSVADCLEVRLHSLSCSSQSPSSLLSSFSCSFDDEKKYPRVASPPARQNCESIFALLRQSEVERGFR